jgi:two-component system OmpR family sensor kinase
VTWRWIPILAPALIGLLLSLLFNAGVLPNPVLYLRSDMGALSTIFGILLSILAGIALLLSDWVDSRQVDVVLKTSADRRRFLRRLDHELKNPLTAILAGLENLSGGEGARQQSASLASVRAQVMRLSRLVSELRKLSDLETRTLELAPVDIGELLEEAYALAKTRPEAGERELSLSIPRAPWPLPTIMADRDLLVLAIHNLLDNALKFTQPGATIEVRALEDGPHVVIEIADTGPGVPSDEVEHVWEELYRGESARALPGSGLGLALVRAIVTRHEGNVSLRSRQAQGTLITIRLPAGGVPKR